MAKLCKGILALGVVLLVVSCASSSIQSNKNPDYNQVMTKLDVLVDVGDHSTMSGDLGDYLVTHIPKAFQADGIDTTVTKLTGTELNNNPATGLVMTINFVEGQAVRTMFGGQIVTDATLDVSIVDKSSNDLVIWKARVKAGAGYGGGMNLDGIITSILTKLEADGLAKAPTKS